MGTAKRLSRMTSACLRTTCTGHVSPCYCDAGEPPIFGVENTPFRFPEHACQESDGGTYSSNVIAVLGPGHINHASRQRPPPAMPHQLAIPVSLGGLACDSKRVFRGTPYGDVV